MKNDYVKNLEEIIKQLIKPIKKIPFNLVIESLYDKKVLHFDLEKKENIILLENLKKIAKNTSELVKESGGIKSERANEVGNYIEVFVKKALEKIGYKIITKVTKSGKSKSSGYPDIQFQDDFNQICYLECKTFNLKNINTTHRSFYLSPSQDPKVNQDGFHLALSFEIEKNIQKKSYYCVSYKIINIEQLPCDLKHEFNSDNKRLYSKQTILAEEKF
jgi:hypothetical protein